MVLMLVMLLVAQVYQIVSMKIAKVYMIPYINGVGELKTSGANPNVAGTSGQSLLFQVYKAGMVFTDFKFKVAL